MGRIAWFYSIATGTHRSWLSWIIRRILEGVPHSEDRKFEPRLQRLFGSNLRAWRTSRGITQEQLAEKLELSARYVRTLETGAGNITLLTMEKVAFALGEDPIEMLAG
ncbi:helix-turn-helix transcriptional regulator [Brevibacterium sp. S111]|uniref:helix-turn-helix domain-containing protein n=1 Tax=Brevibacterium sp. S111 TaxID=2483795 RepID=UPI00108126CC|nr:helix-turn-helix transcriptional regulator [Brevibacterium sp. S111]